MCYTIQYVVNFTNNSWDFLLYLPRYLHRVGLSFLLPFICYLGHQALDIKNNILSLYEQKKMLKV